MSGKHYVIKYGAMDQLFSMARGRIDEWYIDLNSWIESYGNFIEMNSFQGKSAASAKAYLQEVHGILLYSIQQALTAYQSNFLLYKTGYYDIEGNKYASIPQELLNEVVQKLGDESTQLDTISASIQGSLNSICDIFPLTNPTQYVLQDTILGVKKELGNYDSKIDSYEENQYTIVNENVKELLATLHRTIQDYLINGTNIASYTTGAIAGNTNVLDLYDKVQKSSEYIANNQSQIESAATEQAEIYWEMQAEYEAACEARKDQGTAQIIMGGVAVFVGAVAIIGTAGMATPIVVTAGVAGTCSMAYGISNAAEGAQEYYYGSIGDLNSVSVNPIRDTVFAGNQQLYDAWGGLSMTVAGLCVPVGQAVNGVAGASTNVLVKTAIKTVAKETLKDTVYDTASEAITDYATETLGLNQTQSTILNLGLSTGIEKGVEFTGGKLGVIDEPSFSESMSFEDAERYNSYWDNVEMGVHSNYPGLSETDIALWDLADTKLNEHVAVQKVDSDAIVDLRIQELDAQNNFINGTAKVIEGNNFVEHNSPIIEKTFTDTPFDDTGSLKPNVKYTTGEFNYNYETDANGRISNWSTDNLQLTERSERLDHASDTPGKLEGDHAGHLAGDRFGGSSELDNIVSQSQKVNLSQYKKIENQWAQAISEGKDVTVNVDIKYDGDGLRPTEFTVEYTIDGDFFSQSILN